MQSWPQHLNSRLREADLVAKFNDAFSSAMIEATRLPCPQPSQPVFTDDAPTLRGMAEMAQGFGVRLYFFANPKTDATP